MALMRRAPRTRSLPELFGEPMPSWHWPRLWEPFQGLAEMHMPVEEYEEDGKHVVRVELPGIDPEKDVDVSVQDGLLEIQAERHEEKTERPHYYRQEIRYGSFARDIPLPPGCDEEDVSAEYADGILTVRLPLDREKAAAKRIPITRG